MMELNHLLRTSLWVAAPSNFIAAYVFAFPSCSIGRMLELPQQTPNFFTVFSGAMVGLFGCMYVWIALRKSIDRSLLALGACGKTMAVFVSSLMYALGALSGAALLLISGDLIFASLWFFWLVRTR